eukprot:9172511-Prorocentrum_lima.AAC.1
MQEKPHVSRRRRNSWGDLGRATSLTTRLALVIPVRSTSTLRRPSSSSALLVTEASGSALNS